MQPEDNLVYKPPDVPKEEDKKEEKKAAEKKRKKSMAVIAPMPVRKK